MKIKYIITFLVLVTVLISGCGKMKQKILEGGEVGSFGEAALIFNAKYREVELDTAPEEKTKLSKIAGAAYPLLLVLHKDKEKYEIIQTIPGGLKILRQDSCQPPKYEDMIPLALFDNVEVYCNKTIKESEEMIKKSALSVEGEWYFFMPLSYNLAPRGYYYIHAEEGIAHPIESDMPYLSLNAGMMCAETFSGLFEATDTKMDDAIQLYCIAVFDGKPAYCEKIDPSLEIPDKEENKKPINLKQKCIEDANR